MIYLTDNRDSRDATDNKDGDVKQQKRKRFNSLGSSVRTSKAGSYTATYTVSDAAGNQILIYLIM